MKQIALAFLLSAAVGAQAEVLTFDDLVDPGATMRIPDGYAGLDWNNIFTLHATDRYPGTGYDTGTISGQVAFTGSASPGSFSATSSQGFALDSGYFTAAFYDQNAVVTAVFEDGSSATRIFAITTAGPVFETFGWTGLASVTLYGDNANQVVIENLSVRVTDVAEPAELSMALAGLAACALAGRPRRRPRAA